MNKNQQPEWLEWAKELQFIAQAGLTYSKDAFDIERFERKSNTIKEVKEEAGLDVEVTRIIAVQDRNLHNLPPYAYNVCKVFVLCEAKGGDFQPNIETIESGYFSLDEIPPLAEEKNNKEQIEMCFAAYRDKDWEVQFD